MKRFGEEGASDGEHGCSLVALLLFVVVVGLLVGCVVSLSA